MLSIVGCGTIQELTVVGNAMVASFTSCFDDLLKVGAGVAVSVDSQTNIVACIAALFSVSIVISYAMAVSHSSILLLAPCTGLRDCVPQVRPSHRAQLACRDRHCPQMRR